MVARFPQQGDFFGCQAVGFVDQVAHFVFERQGFGRKGAGRIDGSGVLVAEVCQRGRRLRRRGRLSRLPLAAMATSFDPLSADALAFVDGLQRELGGERERLLAARRERVGDAPVFVGAPEEFRVASAPADLADRRVEITGPVERKMMINALNSGARVFMADFEDANSPTWANVVDGQRNVYDAVRRTIELDTGEKSYRLNDEVATLVIRPRGWHLLERHHWSTAGRFRGRCSTSGW